MTSQIPTLTGSQLESILNRSVRPDLVQPLQLDLSDDDVGVGLDEDEESNEDVPVTRAEKPRENIWSFQFNELHYVAIRRAEGLDYNFEITGEGDKLLCTITDTLPADFQAEIIKAAGSKPESWVPLFDDVKNKTEKIEIRLPAPIIAQRQVLVNTRKMVVFTWPLYEAARTQTSFGLPAAPDGQ